MKDIKIRTKLIAGFIFIALLSVVVGIVGITNIRTIDKADTYMYENVVKSLSYTNVIASDFQRLRVNAREIILSDNQQEADKYFTKVEEISTEIDDYLTLYETIISDDTNQKNFDNVVKAKKVYLSYYEKLKEINFFENDSAALVLLRGEWFQANLDFQDATDELVKYNVNLGDTLATSNSELADSSVSMLLIIIIFIIILALILGIGISINIQNIIKNVVNQVKELVDNAVAGNLSKRANLKETNHEFAEIVDGFNKTLDAVIIPLNVAADYVDNISKGNIPAKITDKYNGDFNTIKNNLNQCIDAVNLLVSDAVMLAKAAVEGKLATRANANLHLGDFRKVVQGVNETLDSVINPLNVAADYVDKISKGNIPPKITDSYNGDFNTIKNNLNQCIDALSGLVKDMNNMSNQHDLGDIDIKMDSSKFDGAYKLMAEGVNTMVFGHIAVKKKAMACVDEFGKGNFEAVLEKFPGKKVFINDIIEGIRNNLKEVTGDAKILVDAAIAGKLATRADVRKYKGDWFKLVNGINETLDAVIGPLNVAAEYVAKISIGDIPQQITDNYNGDFNTIKKNLNVLIVATNDIIEKAKLVAKGDLTVQLKKRSDNDELMLALSEMVKAIGFIVKEVRMAADNVASGSLEMSSTSQQMSQGASEQASSIEEVSSSIEQMTANIMQNTENAKQTEQIAIKAANDINEGYKSVNITVAAMKQIAEKISIIGELASKTDLLAINAAIEAARAGEHGKGFAVVANEVRKLAERSSKAAAEIDELSKSSVLIAEKSGILLKEIVPQIEKTASLVQDITAASMEQNSGTNQMNLAVNQLNQVAQVNAASSEEMATSSEELSSQAEQLKEVISFFKVDDDLNLLKKTTKNTKLDFKNLTHTPVSKKHTFEDIDTKFEKF